MQCGTPSVTTSIGAEGMLGAVPPSIFAVPPPLSPASADAVKSDWSGCVTDSVAGFADAACRLHETPDEWGRAQARGADILRQVYTTEAHSRQLVARIRAVRGALEAHRMANFTGAMLRHHSLKSTMYLSRWIELKEQAATTAPPKGGA